MITFTVLFVVGLVVVIEMRAYLKRHERNTDATIARIEQRLCLPLSPGSEKIIVATNKRATAH